ncbi:hypothetical protein BIU98_00520 [Curtobacterium sp. MMLR14_010]|uniref:HIRAN domain-containing protein n=1 Tax=Curtobacterium sp. MMLR14_010 TaxID=1898743 RepID=UPI0008DCDFFA|nr:HIRAN domain-containing protein [Curtobacterium sp. MMLR14_010]OII36069.1 hypothetical protein BIU98_00520 [Curtobacterium sp. MMLR14_010]
MGILNRLFGRDKDQPVDDGAEGLTVLSGTTTTCRDAILALAARHDASDAGYVELNGSLQREPTNPADPNAVAVMVEGERIGYLPGYATAAANVSTIGSRAVRVQIFTEMLPKGPRAEAWAWLGNGSLRWEWTSTNRPPMSSKAKAAAHHEGSREMVREGLARGGQRAAEFNRGMVNGVHYLELAEPIKELKRENRLEEALDLCHAAIQGAEASRDGREPAPFYTEQAAIILRKLGRRDDEIAVLQRWLKLCPPEHRDGSRIGARLVKLMG